MASVTLDASVKIYSCRVDSIHSEAYKVLGGISRSDAKSNKNGGDHADDGGSDSEQSDAKKKQRKKVRSSQFTNSQEIFEIAIEILYKQTWNFCD